MQKHSYHAFFKDTDGLRNGSPVKYMGVEIGYVSNVSIIDSDEIFVSFIITSKNTSIPNGTSAKIESTGIVGSRSLELYPPEKNQDTKSALIIAKNPTRVQGAFYNSSRISEVLYMTASGFNKIVGVDKIPTIRRFIHTAPAYSDDAAAKIEEINTSQENLINELKNNSPSQRINEKLEKFSQ